MSEAHDIEVIMTCERTYANATGAALGHVTCWRRWVLALAAIVVATSATAAPPRFVAPGDVPVYVSPTSGSELRILIDTALGGTAAATVAVLTMPPGTDSSDHAHGSTEIFYVLEGEFEQTIEGETRTLGPGMAALVPGGTPTRHKVTSDIPVKTLVIWVPGGEEAGIKTHWKKKE